MSDGNASEQEKTIEIPSESAESVSPRFGADEFGYALGRFLAAFVGGYTTGIRHHVPPELFAEFADEANDDDDDEE